MIRLKSLRVHRWSLFSVALAVAPAAIAAGSDEQLYLLRFEAPAVVEAVDASVLAKRGSAEGQSQFEVQAKRIRRTQDDELQVLEGLLGRPLKTRFRYTYGVNGAALWLSATEAERLQSAPGVASLVPDSIERLHTDAGPGFIGADQVWSGTTTGLAGKRGEGVVIGVIDTGVKANHPSFADVARDGYDHQNPRGQRFGLCTGAAPIARCNDKLIGVYDYIGEGAQDGGDTHGHGTHVSSIALGNPISGGLDAPTLSIQLIYSGVAPRANLISYKVCREEDGGGCPSSATIAALDQAIADGVDVINYSLGAPPRNPWLELNSASGFRSMLNARAAGIVVTVSAGNSGPVAGSVGSPANAPWVLAVGNITHDRVFQTTLTDLSGSTPPPQGTFEGFAVGAGTNGTAPIVLGEQKGSALCSKGSELDSPPTGISNPFAPGSLTGLIVVCDRGVQARIAKGNNVALGGGVGMVLANTALEGENVAVDGHRLPAVNLGFQSGERLRQWLRSTSGARGRITATTAARVARYGDLVSTSSGRGPDASAGVAKPNLSAPGTLIMAASIGAEGLIEYSGTSMAAPHVAGAAALLKSLHPDWSAEQIISALVLTAEPAEMRKLDGNRARFADTGSGRTQVQRAARAGLYLPLSKAEFEQANPAVGGSPQALNLAELFHPGCRSRCSLLRTVTASAAGSWTASVEVPAGMVVNITPAQFSLVAGASQTLRFEFDVSAGALLGQWLDGRVHLQPSDPQAQPLNLPMQIYADPGSVPAQIALRVSGERGVADFSLGGGLVALPGAHYQALGPVTSNALDFSLAADTDQPTSAFNDDGGTKTELVTVSTGSAALLVMLRSTDGVSDVNLYVGRDVNGDGVASSSETLCGQRSEASREQCVLSPVSAGAYWVRIHNPTSSSQPVQLEYAALRASESLVSGAARVAVGTSLDLQLAYDLGGSSPTLRQLAVLQAYAEFDASKPFAQIALVIDRDVQASSKPQLLSAGVDEQYVLTSGTALSGLFFDDPGNGQLQRMDFTGPRTLELKVRSMPLPGAPLTAPPEAVELLTQTAFSAGGEFSIPVSTSPRRLYLSVASSSPTQTASFSLKRSAGTTAAVSSSGTRPGMYFNPARGGHGLFLTRARNDLQVAWYSYDQQGRPIFYLAQAADAFVADQPGLRAQVRMDLSKYVWNGRSALGQVVGSAELTSLAADRFQWSWTLDQSSGSEPMELLAASACVSNAGNTLDYSGLWFNPELPGYGASIFTRPDLELQAVYLYDQQGLPRWLWSEATPFGSASSPLYQYSGFCTGCSYAPVSRVSVGTLTRSYSSTPGSAGQWRVQASFGAPLLGSGWDTSGPLLALTESGVCR